MTSQFASEGQDLATANASADAANVDAATTATAAANHSRRWPQCSIMIMVPRTTTTDEESEF